MRPGKQELLRDHAIRLGQFPPGTGRLVDQEPITCCLLMVCSRNAVFYPVKPPTFQDLERLVQKIAERVSRYLEKARYLVRDSESEYLDLYTDEEGHQDLFDQATTLICFVDHSAVRGSGELANYWVKVGPRTGTYWSLDHAVVQDDEVFSDVLMGCYLWC